MLNLAELLPTQAMTASMLMKHRRLMVMGPRQFFGKTEIGVRLGEDCLSSMDAATGLFLAKDTKSARRATREKFLRIYDGERFNVNTDRIVKKSNPRCMLNIASVDRDPDRLRGGTNHFIHWSEVAFSKLDHGETITGVFDKVIQPTSAIFDAYQLLESTPNGQNGWYDLWNNAAAYGFRTLKITFSQMLEMGFVTQAEFDRIKDTTHPLVFRQEFECDFVTFQGRAYDEFDEAMHVADVPAPADWMRVILACDWGYDPSATCVLFGYVRDGVLYVFDEIYEKRQLIQQTADHIDSIRQRWSIKQIAGVADHEQDRIDELNLRGIPCGKANKANVLGNRIEVKELLWKDRIVIDPRCKYLIRDLTTATWHDKKEGELDFSQCNYGHFDAEAALRYMVRELSKFELDEPEVNPHTTTDQASARAWNLARRRDEVG